MYRDNNNSSKMHQELKVNDSQSKHSAAALLKQESNVAHSFFDPQAETKVKGLLVSEQGNKKY